MLAPNKIYQGDCIAGLAKIAPGSVDLAFADPPFNIGYEYDVYEDSRSSAEYLAWTRNWMSGVWRALKSSGAFWLAIGDEYAAELKVLAQDLGFRCRSWVIWYYTFGVNCTQTYNRSHTHLIYFTKDPGQFTFNAENPAVRVPSARQLVYADGRANPRGRLPDNTWILRPQDVPGGFGPSDNTWYFARVAGTFKEREGFHGCQMPEQLLGRIIRGCSNPREIVLDPFGGSGTTLTVAKKLGRQWIGFELSKDYVKRIRQRLDHARAGDPLDGPADPLTSAPSTARGKRRRGPSLSSVNGNGVRRRPASCEGIRELEIGIAEAYRCTSGGQSVDQLLANPELNAAFVERCKTTGLPGGVVQWNLALLRVRKAGKQLQAEKRAHTFTFEEMDSFSFASEIALQQLSVEFGLTLDGILCDPRLAAKFDELAAVYSPGFSPFQYRWAALAIRKRARRAKTLANDRHAAWCKMKLPRARSMRAGKWDSYQWPGVYLIGARNERHLYIGETLNLRKRIETVNAIPYWQSLELSSIKLIREEDKPFALQAFLICRMNPLLNWRLLSPDSKRNA